MNATPLPVSSALAGQRITRCARKAIPTSRTAHVPSETQDLRDRELEVEADLADHLQRRDRRGEVTAVDPAASAAAPGTSGR
jgi:hypothetical protein